MDLKTLIEKLLTVAPPGAVVENVVVLSGWETLGSDISDIWYDEHTKTIVIQGD